MTARAQTLVLYVPEPTAVGFADHFQRGASRRMYAVPRIIAVRAADLQPQVVLGDDLPHSFGKAVFVGLRQRYKFRHVVFQLFVHFDKAENTPVYVRCEFFRHTGKGFDMPFHGIFFREQNGVVTPGYLLSADYFFQFGERLHTVLRPTARPARRPCRKR